MVRQMKKKQPPKIHGSYRNQNRSSSQEKQLCLDIWDPAVESAVRERQPQRLPGIFYFGTERNFKKLRGLCFLVALCFVASSCAQTAPESTSSVASTQTQTNNQGEELLSEAENPVQSLESDAAQLENEKTGSTPVQGEAVISAGEAVCGDDQGPACPLVKPVFFEELVYSRTAEQIAKMEAFDKLSLEEKGKAMANGEVVCTLFIHDDKWEHEIAPQFISYVGQENFDEWQNQRTGCGSIYEFADAFALEFSTLKEIIVENNLQETYIIDRLEEKMEK